MEPESYSLNELADKTGFEARTIRSYIERGLLPGSGARGRGASYSAEHLIRLRAIQILRRVRPNIQLNDIRIFLQGMSPQQLSDFCSGSIRATASALAETVDEDEASETLRVVGQFLQPEVDAVAGADAAPACPEVGGRARTPGELTGPGRLLQALKRITRPGAALPGAKTDTWVRLPVTDDVELAVRTGFAVGQMPVLREVADLLRTLLLKPDALIPGEDE